METKDLRYFLRFLPHLGELAPWLLDITECSHLECNRDRVNQAWTDLESIYIILCNLLKHRPLL